MWVYKSEYTHVLPSSIQNEEREAVKSQEQQIELVPRSQLLIPPLKAARLPGEMTDSKTWVGKKRDESGACSMTENKMVLK